MAGYLEESLRLADEDETRGNDDLSASTRTP
jgi:hypothetical protein